MFRDLFHKTLANQQMRQAFVGKSYFEIDTTLLQSALEAGANPNLQIAWQNNNHGGTWSVPVLIATVLGGGSFTSSEPHFDCKAADLLLASGADPHKQWKGSGIGLGWSFTQWVFETGSEEGWLLLRRHQVDPAPALNLPRVQQDPIYRLPVNTLGQNAIQNEMKAVKQSAEEAHQLSCSTPIAPVHKRSHRL